jgi:integrase
MTSESKLAQVGKLDTSADRKERRPDGFGTFEHRDGKVRTRLPRSLDPARKSRTFDDEQKAESFIRGASALLAEHRPIAGATLAQHAKQWLDRRECNGVRGVQQERSVWRNHVAPYPLGRAPITTITRRDVREHFEALQQKRTKTGEVDAKGKAKLSQDFVSHQVLKHALRLVRGCLADAVEREVIETNPARDYKLPKPPPRTDEPWTFLELPEIAIVTGVVDAPTKEKLPLAERTIYTVAIYTGLREGELWGLREKDCIVDGDRPHLVVRYSNAKGSATKSGKIRRVPLLEPARLALKAWLASKERPKNSYNVVFPTVRGCRRQKSDDAGWSTRKVRSKLRIGWKERVGITRDVRFHDMRHTCGSHLVMGSWGRTWTLLETRDFLGHSDVKVTERYAHLAPDHLHAAARATAATAGIRVAPSAEARLIAPTEPACCAASCGPTAVPGSNSGASLSDEKPRIIEGRAMRDSNPRPLASEGSQQPSGGADLRHFLASLGPESQQSAERLLIDVATKGEVTEQSIVGLADLVLDHPVAAIGALALRVKEGGPFALRRGIELAAAICEAARAARMREVGT